MSHFETAEPWCPAPLDEQREPEDCGQCQGLGYHVGHEDACYDTGDCGCSGVQIQCASCGGSGKEAMSC